MRSPDYVHGYSDLETRRLYDQAATLAELLHWDTLFPAGTKVLEAGCGVGAQTVILARKNPQAEITAIDISPDSINQTRLLLERESITNVTLKVADLFNLPFVEASFDHLFVCFVLEHLKDPQAALTKLSKVLKPGGTLTVIEGDHGSALFYPESQAARLAIRCLIDLQAAAGGDALIGRRLYPLLRAAGFRNVRVSPRLVYADASRPEWVEGFTKKTFTAMVEGVRQPALASQLIDPQVWEEGVRGLYRTAEADGVFSYLFFKAMGIK